MVQGQGGEEKERKEEDHQNKKKKRYRQNLETPENPIKARAGQEGGWGSRERFVVGEDSRSSSASARLYTVGESAEQTRSPRLEPIDNAADKNILSAPRYNHTSDYTDSILSGISTTQ